MFGLNWFPKWNRENPTDIYGPAIIIGALGGAIFLAAMIVAWGRPFPVTTVQTGPRGTGMDLVTFTSEVEAGDPTAALYADTTFPVEPPQPGDALAKDVYQNVQVLGDLTENNFNRLMNSITAWVSPEQGCAYCHGDGGLETYGEDTLYTKVVARSMLQMTQTLNSDYVDHVGPAGVNCFTCHRGQNVPSGVWFRITPVTKATAGWASVQNRATSLSQSTSLPSDALEKYLVEYEPIAVHDLESRVAGGPAGGTAGGGLPAIQNTERTYALMNYIDNSLGVNCVFCHNTRAFYDPDQHTPQWTKAQLGIGMVLELNNTWLLPLAEVLPPERLGPIHGDAPKAACSTCHKGHQKPMNGLSMVSDWPELMAPGAPVYE